MELRLWHKCLIKLTTQSALGVNATGLELIICPYRIINSLQLIKRKPAEEIEKSRRIGSEWWAREFPDTEKVGDI